MPINLNINELYATITEQFDIFICSSSFEERSFSVAANLPREKFKAALICTNRDYDEHVRENLKILVDMFSENHFVADVYTSNPIKSADNIEELLQKISAMRSLEKILIDITTFTHETILIVLAILQNKYPKAEITCCYTNAKEYSSDQDEQKDKWLSRGVGDVRTILGYPGTMKPSLQTHLIVIVGYEYERAIKIIEALEPDSLSLGYGLASDATTEKNRGANEQFANLVKEMSAFYDDISEFIVPCNSPYEACKSILDEINHHKDKNIVIVPMNNKISTLGTALAYNANSEIQLCYAPALIYNYKFYSIPGNTCYLFDWSMPKTKNDRT